MKYSISAKNVVWIHVSEPESEELIAFVREANLLTADAEYIVRDHRHPEVVVRSEYILMLVLIPAFNKKLRITVGVPVYLVIRDGNVLSLQREPLPTLDQIRRKLAQSLEEEEEFFEDNALCFSLYILDRLYAGAFRKLERLGKHIDIAEDAIFQGNERRMVEEISLLARDVLDFRKIIRPQTTLFGTAIEHSLVTGGVITQWQQLHRQLQKLWAVLENLFESVRELGRSDQMLIQHKENELLRLLTFYSIIAIPVFLLVQPYYSPRAADASLTDVVVFWVVFSTLVFVLLLIVLRAKSKRIL